MDDLEECLHASKPLILVVFASSQFSCVPVLLGRTFINCCYLTVTREAALHLISAARSVLIPACPFL